MKRLIVKLSASLYFASVLSLASPLLSTEGQAFAQDRQIAPRTPSCTNGTASGTFGYRMSGQIIGVGPVLVNGLFTHNPDGTMSGNVYLNIAGQTIPDASWADGTFTTNDDCTGSGSFFVAALNQVITYNFIVTDGGRQIDLLNTNAGNAFHGAGRRVHERGRAPSCTNGTILGSYGYRLDGSIPNVPAYVGAGLVTHGRGEDGINGVISGADTAGFNGQFVPRTYQGTYRLNSDCTGTASYTDSLNNTVNYVFVVVGGGEEIYFLSINPGDIVSGVARRVR